MGKGKQKLNPYMIFINEQKRVQPDWSGKSNPELVVLADPLWTSLTDAQRSVYVEKAKELKGGQSSGGAVGGAGSNNNYLAYNGGGGTQRVQGYDTRGRRLEEVAKRDRDIVEVAKSKVTSTADIVTMAVENGAIEETTFFIMHANIFVRTPDDNLVVPAEIAMTKFTIEDGVVETPIQFFPDPGKIPSGYKYSCMETSDIHHKIPLYPDLLHQDKDKTLTGTEFISEYPSDDDILAGIRSFLGGCRTVFCMENNEEDCQGVLDSLATRSKLPPLDLQLLHLPDLLHQLAGPRMLPHVILAIGEFERERFLYQYGLGCPWHEAGTETDERAVHKCSLSYVHRWAFTILAFTNKRFQIVRVDGRHVPEGTLLQEQEAAEFGDEQWGLDERKEHRTAIGSSYGRGGFPSTDIRYRTVSSCQVGDAGTDARSDVGTVSEFLAQTSVSDLATAHASHDAGSEFDTEYESLDVDGSARSSLASSARSSLVSGGGAARKRGTLLENLRNRRIAANLQNK